MFYYSHIRHAFTCTCNCVIHVHVCAYQYTFMYMYMCSLSIATCIYMYLHCFLSVHENDVHEGTDNIFTHMYSGQMSLMS